MLIWKIYPLPFISGGRFSSFHKHNIPIIMVAWPNIMEHVGCFIVYPAIPLWIVARKCIVLVKTDVIVYTCFMARISSHKLEKGITCWMEDENIYENRAMIFCFFTWDFYLNHVLNKTLSLTWNCPRPFKGQLRTSP